MKICYFLLLTLRNVEKTLPKNINVCFVRQTGSWDQIIGVLALWS